MWVATNDLPRSAAHPFYARLNQILDEHNFDGYVEGLCRRFYAEDGRSGLLPGRYFRLLLIGYFEGLDAERAIAWRAADSFALRDFLGLVLPDASPDHSTISRTRRLIDVETHEAVFTWMLQRLADAGLVKGKTVERPSAHLYETGGMRRVHLRGHTNILKRVLIHVGGFNLGLLMRQLIGVGTPRGLQGRLSAVLVALLVLIRSLSKPVRRHERAARHVSPLKRRSIEYTLALGGVREMAFTTGC
jgi:transposase